MRRLSYQGRPRLLRGVSAVVTALLLTTPASAADENAVGTKTVAGREIPADLSLSLWAKQPMVASPVGLAVDHDGVVYATRTVRRKSSDLDIRDHWEWKVADLGLRRVEDKRRFFKRTLSPKRSDANASWLEDRNGDGSHDWRDLTVEAEKIHRIRDTDRDGKADAWSVFADGFDSEVTGVAGGVLARGSDVYVTCNPSLWKLRDTDGDGQADKRKALSTGYGVHIALAGHNMSGPTVGPDGRIYWAIGDQGVNVRGPDDRRWRYPDQGAVMRCNPDGSGFEVFAHGLRNPQEIAFDDHGNLFSVDNDSNKAGDHERIVHITEGSDSGWRIYWQYGAEGYNPWMDEGLYKPAFDGQPAYITPAVAHYHNGPAGFASEPGTALSDRWRGHFFASFYNGSAANSHVMAFRLEEDGATFALASDRKVVDGVAATGLAFGPGGALYVADWIGGWSPKEKGRIWKVDTPSTEGSTARRETRRLLGGGFTDRSIRKLRELLGHEDRRVRMEAQFELVARGERGYDALLAAAHGHDEPLARLHGIWGVGQIGREKSEKAAPLTDLLDDPSAEVRAQAAKVLGEAEYAPAASPLRARLDDDSERVRFYAAMALGDLGDAKAIGPILEMVAAAGPDAAYLRHAAVMGLTGIGDAERLAAQSTHPSLAVRLACVVALRRMGSPSVARFLDDPKTRVVVEAARAIHDDFSIPEALPELAALIDREGLPQNEALLRRVINANLRVGGAAHAKALGRFALRESAPSAMRREAIRSLAVWAEPPLLDRVEGRYRGLGVRPSAPAKAAVGRVYENLPASSPTSLRTAAIAAVGELRYRPAAPSLRKRLTASDEPTALRLAALEALKRVSSGKKLRNAVERALDDPAKEVRKRAQQMMASIAPTPEKAVEVLAKTLEEGTRPEKQAALRTLGGLDDPRAHAVLEDWMDKLLADKVPPALRLDLLAAVEKADDKTLSKMADRYRDGKPEDDPLSPWMETLRGGDPEKGRRIVHRSEKAQCLRCHAIGGRGGDVAPPLTHVASRADRRHLLEALVRPNATIAEGYGTVVLTLDDGSTVAGTLAAETESRLTVQTPAGRKRTVKRSRIADRSAADRSAMPSMAEILTDEEIRDVIAYLATLD